jgi:hypothetical protein
VRYIKVPSWAKGPPDPLLTMSLLVELLEKLKFEKRNSEAVRYNPGKVCDENEEHYKLGKFRGEGKSPHACWYQHIVTAVRRESEKYERRLMRETQ